MRGKAASCVAIAIAVFSAAVARADGFRFEASAFGTFARLPRGSLDLTTPRGAPFGGFDASLLTPDNTGGVGIELETSYVAGHLWIPALGAGVALTGTGPDVTDRSGARFSARSATFSKVDGPGVGIAFPIDEGMTLSFAVRGSLFGFNESGSVTQGSLTVDAKASALWFALTGDARLEVGDRRRFVVSVRPVVLDQGGAMRGFFLHLGGAW